MTEQAIDGQVDLDGNVLVLDRIDGIEIREYRLQVSGMVEWQGIAEIGDSVQIDAVVIGRRYRALKGDGGPEAAEVVILARAIG